MGGGEGEVRDVVDNVVEEASARLAIERDKDHHETRKKTVIAVASVYLGVALNKSDRVAVATMLKRSGFTFVQLTARVQRYLGRHLRGDEGDYDVQRMVDAWTAHRLAEQPSSSSGRSLGNALAAVRAASAAGTGAAPRPPLLNAVHNPRIHEVVQQVPPRNKSTQARR